MRKADAAYASTLTTEESKRVAVPALVVVCEKDYVCIPEFQKQTAATYLRNHRVESLPCGHWIMLEMPTELVRILGEFKKGLGAT
jgi:pimeloyl-ACP methyl ester carboxylesterase